MTYQTNTGIYTLWEFRRFLAEIKSLASVLLPRVSY